MERKLCYLLETQVPCSTTPKGCLKVKVGSTVNLHRRRLELQASEQVRYVAVSEGGEALETELKRKYKPFLALPTSTEWFFLPQKVFDDLLSSTASKWVTDPTAIVELLDQHHSCALKKERAVKKKKKSHHGHPSTSYPIVVDCRLSDINFRMEFAVARLRDKSCLSNLLDSAQEASISPQVLRVEWFESEGVMLELGEDRGRQEMKAILDKDKRKRESSSSSSISTTKMIAKKRKLDGPSSSRGKGKEEAKRRDEDGPSLSSSPSSPSDDDDKCAPTGRQEHHQDDHDSKEVIAVDVDEKDDAPCASLLVDMLYRRCAKQAWFKNLGEGIPKHRHSILYMKSAHLILKHCNGTDDDDDNDDDDDADATSERKKREPLSLAALLIRMKNQLQTAHGRKNNKANKKKTLLLDGSSAEKPRSASEISRDARTLYEKVMDESSDLEWFKELMKSTWMARIVGRDDDNEEERHFLKLTGPQQWLYCTCYATLMRHPTWDLMRLRLTVQASQRRHSSKDHDNEKADDEEEQPGVDGNR